MPDIFNGHTAVLAGHGFSSKSPYLTINDVEAKTVNYLPVLGRTFTLERLPGRRCIGRFDLETYEKSVCPMNVELLPDSKETMCPACIEATGFNPSFYFSDHVSPQQRAYNMTPHFVYLAYFSPQHVKAGISSETRGIERLLEQGARAGRIVGRFPNADAARGLEAALCAQEDVLETMRASLKTRLLVESRFDPNEAVEVLDAAAKRLGAVPAVAQAGFSPEPACDLSPFYFGGPSPDVHDITLPDPDRFDAVCGGRCIGMVGGNLVFQQGQMAFVTSVKEWESYEVRFLDGEVACEYDSEPQQFSMF